MRTRQLCLLVTCICTFSAARAQLFSEMPKTHVNPGVPTRSSMAASQDTGTIIKKSIKWESAIPLDKTYEQLTPEQKAELRKLYVSLGPDDEPPFPAAGIKPIFNAIKRAQHFRQARGELNMAVTVGPDGKATKVEDFGGVYDVEMTELTQQVLLLTKYKPAVCSGTPCTMQFRFTQNLNPANGLR